MNKSQELDAVKMAIFGMLASHLDSAAIDECKAEAEKLIAPVRDCTDLRECVIKSCALLIASAELEKVVPDI